MKPEKNSKKSNIKKNSATQLVAKSRNKRNKKFQSFAAQNLAQISALLAEYRSDDKEINASILDFLNCAIQGKECQLSFPSNFDVGLMSLLLSDMARWLGNTQQSLKHQQFIKKVLDSAEDNS